MSNYKRYFDENKVVEVEGVVKEDETLFKIENYSEEYLVEFEKDYIEHYNTVPECIMTTTLSYVCIFC